MKALAQNTWTGFLRGILRIPGAKVDRDDFLRKAFKSLPPDAIDIMLAHGPQAVVTPEAIQRKAMKIIAAHTRGVTAVSAAAGIPGGIGMLASIPADLTNYYYHIVLVGQKLGYLYGYPDMLDADENLTEAGRTTLTAFIGIMSKVTAAQELIRVAARESARRISGETATRVAGKLLSKQIISQMAEAVAHKLGTHITAKSGGRVLTKAIPVVSGVICGCLTYATFRPAAIRLERTLRQLAADRLLPES